MVLKMIKSFEISNIKSFSAAQKISLAPITLIYGQNSSGKSSILQSLLLLKQSLLFGEDADYLVTNDKYVAMGGFKSLVHRHDITKEVRLSLDFDKNYEAREYYIRNGRNLPFANAARRSFSIAYKCDPHEKSGLARMTEFVYSMAEKKIDFRISRHGGSDSSRYRFSTLNEGTIKYLSAEAQIEISNDDFKEHLSHCDELNLPAKVVGKKSDKINKALNPFLDDLQDLFASLKYMGPLRSAPRRIYSSDNYALSQQKGKNNLGVELYRCEEAIIEKINFRLMSFKIPYEISVSNIGNDASGEVISLTLKDLRSGAVITPVDVGFGIGQIMPIILEALVNKQKILCVEQPEIHLHPQLQANMADLFIDSVKQGNQWIIETHSEALMLRLQKRIREGVISSEMISVVYVDVGNNGASAINIPLDKKGNFTIHWPGGFFEERMSELYGE